MPDGRDWEGNYRNARTPWRSRGLSTTTLEQLMHHGKPGKVVEVGCGQGDDAAGFRSAGYSYVGIDFSPSAIEAARGNHRAREAQFICGDFLEWVPNEPVSVVYDKGFFHGLQGEVPRVQFVFHVASMLARDGIWLTVCGCADGRSRSMSHGAVYLRHLIEPAELYFEVLEVRREDYGLRTTDFRFDAWYGAFRRRS